MIIPSVGREKKSVFLADSGSCNGGSVGKGWTIFTPGEGWCKRVFLFL